MDRDRRLSLTVGVFALVAIGTLAVAILSLSSQRGIWKARYRLEAHFDNVGGLISGAPVWLAGNPVGHVRSVEFGARDSGAMAVTAVLEIEKEVQERIRGDSVATVGTMGVLGDRYVEIGFGSPDTPALADGDEIATADPVDINRALAEGSLAVGQIRDLASNLNVVLKTFNDASGAQHLTGFLTDMREIGNEVKQGNGLMHSLIYDQYQGGGVESIENSLATLEGILTEIRHGDGLMHSLIYDAPTEQDVLLQVVEAGARLNGILGKIDSGQGTLGLLVNDPTLYEDLKMLVGGANRSTVVRGMIRMISEPEE